MPELLLSAKLAVEKGLAQGRNESYVKQLSDYIVPALVEALHKVVALGFGGFLLNAGFLLPNCLKLLMFCRSLIWKFVLACWMPWMSVHRYSLILRSLVFIFLFFYFEHNFGCCIHSLTFEFWLRRLEPTIVISEYKYKKLTINWDKRVN